MYTGTSPAIRERSVNIRERLPPTLYGRLRLTMSTVTASEQVDRASVDGRPNNADAERGFLHPQALLVGSSGSLEARLSSGGSYQNADNYSYSRDTLPSTSKPRTVSPDEFRRSTSSSAKRRLKGVPEEMESSNTELVDGQRHYGSMNMATRIGGSTYVDGTLTYEEDSELSEEEEEWLLDEELAKQGLYRGNYKNLILLYTLVPLSAGLAFVLLALIPVFAFPSSSPSLFPYPPYFPYPLPEIITATALWSVSYLSRDFLYATSLLTTSWMPFPTILPVLTSLISAVLQSVSTLFFRQLAVPVLLIPYYSTERLGLLQASNDLHKHHFPTWQDDAFRRVWWIALGWAAAEAVVGIKQGYESIALYKDVLVNISKSTSKAGLMTETRANGTREIDQGPRKRNDSRDRTPVGSRIINDGVTPTQTDQRTLSLAGAAKTRSLSQTRGLSDNSLSSSNSSRPNSRYGLTEDLRGSLSLGETQPLLSLDTNRLKRTQTQESDRILAENEVERDIDQLMALKSREELEEIYGIPVIRIPSFISCLHRINSIFVSLGSCLLLTAAYMRSTFAYSFPPSGSLSPPTLFPDQLVHQHRFSPSNKTLNITLPVLLAVQTALTMMHTPWVLPRIGIQTFVYVTLLVSLGLFFSGLGLWEALM